MNKRTEKTSDMKPVTISPQMGRYLLVRGGVDECKLREIVEAAQSSKDITDPKLKTLPGIVKYLEKRGVPGDLFASVDLAHTNLMLSEEIIVSSCENAADIYAPRKASPSWML